MDTVYVISDLHLDHENIIDYCNRPFEDIDQMNKVLINNWNDKVKENDTILFLGDLALSSKSRSKEFLRNLNGKKLCIKGNHDDFTVKQGFMDSYKINYEGFEFYCCHRLKDIPEEWSGWSLIGHHHNNNLTKYPFINKNNKTVNCSVELLNYEPQKLDDIINKIRSTKNKKYKYDK